MKEFRVGTKVLLISNNAGSQHRIGSIGKVVRCDPPSGYIPAAYLIEVNGYYSDGGTWSFPGDLKPIIENLHPHTKVI